MGSKIAGLMLDPVTKGINKSGKADTNKMYLIHYKVGMMWSKRCQSATTTITSKNTQNNLNKSFQMRNLVTNILCINGLVKSKETSIKSNLLNNTEFKASTVSLEIPPLKNIEKNCYKRSTIRKKLSNKSTSKNQSKRMMSFVRSYSVKWMIPTVKRSSKNIASPNLMTTKLKSFSITLKRSSRSDLPNSKNRKELVRSPITKFSSYKRNLRIYMQKSRLKKSLKLKQCNMTSERCRQQLFRSRRKWDCCRLN